MRMWERARNLKITNRLAIALNGEMTVETAPGTITTLTPAELASLDNIAASDLQKIDGITNGTGAASKALVLDSSGNIAMPASGEVRLSTEALAAAGTSSSDAAVISEQITAVTGATGATGVALPAAASAESFFVQNTVNDQILLVYPVNGGNDVINEQAEDIAFPLAPGRGAWFIATSATQWYVDSAAEAFPIADMDVLRFRIFDDFTDAAIDTTDHWIVFEGSDGDATVAVTVTAPEGKVDMGSGGAGSTNDKSVMSLILLAKGSLVSLGTTVFEIRVSFDQIAGTSWGFGFGDVLANATEVANFKVNSGTVTDDSGVTNGIAIMFSTDATATTLFQAVSTNGGTVGNSAAEETLTDGPTADTYDVLRIEIDSTGDARFYVNGTLRLSRATAVATTSLLIPYIWGDSGDDADTPTDVSIDYILFEGTRPASNA